MSRRKRGEKRVPKAWNGGSVETALELAREMRKKLIAQGASLCKMCDGEGGHDTWLCEDCHGAGVILPEGGLRLETERRE